MYSRKQGVGWRYGEGKPDMGGGGSFVAKEVEAEEGD